MFGLELQNRHVAKGLDFETSLIVDPKAAMVSPLASQAKELLASSFPGFSSDEVLPSAFGKPGKIVVSAKEKGQLVSIGAGELFNLGLEEETALVAYLSVIAVCPQCRGRGISTAIWGEIVAVGQAPDVIAATADHPAAYKVVSSTPGYDVFPQCGISVPSHVVAEANQIVAARKGVSIVNNALVGPDLVRRNIYDSNPQGDSVPWQQHELGQALSVQSTDGVFVIGNRKQV